MGFCLRHSGLCLGMDGVEKAPEVPVGGAQSPFTRENSVSGLASPHHSVPSSHSPFPHPTFRLAGPAADLVLVEEGQVHVNIPHGPIVPLERYHCLLHAGEARRGAGQWTHTGGKNSKFNLGIATLTTSGVRLCPPHPPHQVTALSAAGSRGPAGQWSRTDRP